MRRVRRFWKHALVGAAAAGLFAFVVPVLGAQTVDADHLRLTNTYQGFFYGDDNPSGTSEQLIATGNNSCELTVASRSGPLVVVSSNAGGNIKDAGFFDNGLGVKSQGANGAPCSETSGEERLTIQANAGQTWAKLRLDVQPKSNAWIKAELYAGVSLVETHELVTGSSIAASGEGTPDDLEVPYTATTTAADKIASCANPSDSGPDAGPNDNCIWTIDPVGNFNRVVIYTTVGSVALEGGQDFAGISPAGFDGLSFDSLFYRGLEALADSYSTNEDTPLNVAAPGVLSNDSLPAGPVTLSVTDQPDHGTLSLNNDGSFLYTPGPNYHGPDSFTYQATVGSQVDSAGVSITVNPVNDPPVAKGTPLDATEDTSTTYSGDHLATDVDGDALIISAASASGSIPVIVNPDGTASYTPPSDVCGPAADTLTFTVSDGNGGTVSGSVAINIACAPDNDSYEMDELVHTSPFGVATLNVAAPGVLANDGAPLTVLADSGSSTEGGVFSVQSDGSFSYTPGFPYAWGPDQFSYVDTWTYNVDDAAFPNPVTVSITVHRVICSGQSVVDTDGGIIGEYTLLSGPNICKRYEVIAYQGSDPETDPSTITFNPTLNGGPVEMFRGVLTFDPQPAPAGSFFVGLEYDPDLDGPLVFRPLLPCIAPVFGDGFPLVTSATLPAAPVYPDPTLNDPSFPTETWCLAAGTFLASPDGLSFVPTAITYGEEDPTTRYFK